MKSVFPSQFAWKWLGGALTAGVLALSMVMLAPTAGVSAASLSGERVNGQSTLEPVFDDMSGNVAFISTPANAKFNPNPHGWAPIYIPVYPLSAADSVGVLQCTHSPMDNCPDHGPAVAAAAEQVMPSVYGAGVLGHDHLLAVPGSGGDFNVAWEPVIVLFTTAAAATTRITTLAQLNALAAGPNPAVIEIDAPSLTFHCSVVSGAVYAHATPVTPVPGS